MEGSEADEARFIRRKHKEGGYDSQEDQQDRNFTDNLQKALNSHSKKALMNNLEQQLEYFGNKIEPFNMRSEEQMGEIDQDGFFVFNKKRGYRDAWLDSIGEQDEEQVVDSMRKRIKEDGRELGVNDAERRMNEDYDPKEESQDENREELEEEEEGQGQKKGEGLSGMQIKTILADLLPFGMTANKYMKQLKKSKDNEGYQKVLYLCNEYIASTGQHDILTTTKEDLEQQVEEAQQPQKQEPLADWNESSSESAQGQPDQSAYREKPEQQAEDEDAIF